MRKLITRIMFKLGYVRYDKFTHDIVPELIRESIRRGGDGIEYVGDIIKLKIAAKVL